MQCWIQPLPHEPGWLVLHGGSCYSSPSFAQPQKDNKSKMTFLTSSGLIQIILVNWTYELTWANHCIKVLASRSWPTHNPIKKHWFVVKIWSMWMFHYQVDQWIKPIIWLRSSNVMISLECVLGEGQWAWHSLLSSHESFHWGTWQWLLTRIFRGTLAIILPAVSSFPSFSSSSSSFFFFLVKAQVIIMKNLENTDKQSGEEKYTKSHWPLDISRQLKMYHSVMHTLLWVMAFAHHNNSCLHFTEK